MADRRLSAVTLVILGTCSFLVSLAHTSKNPEVRVQQGLLKGKLLTFFQSKDKYVGFLGIPYAKPPVGHLKFKAPEAPEPWSGKRDATSEGPKCAQRNDLTRLLMGEDDCLFLNVFTPKLPDYSAESLRPVMVFIHGGGFYFGSSSSRVYGADYLVAQGVVLVTINYRLGPQGFLSLENEEVPGNAGLKDQVMALRWVQQNVARFGGDPGNVTIFGQSAGGASVGYHMLSPMSKGLFHRAIAQSGSVLNSWAFTNSSRQMAFRLGEKLGIKTEDPKELLKRLRSVDTRALTKASHEVLRPEEKPMSFGFAFLPTTDSASGGEVFLPAPPTELLDSGKLNTVPLIAGINSHEGILALNVLKENTKALDILNKEFERAIPADFPVARNTSKSHEISNMIKKFYFGDQHVSEETILHFVNMITDVWFVKDINTAVDKMAAVSTSPVYYYEFSFSGPFGIIKKLLGAESLPGAAHADELGYLFHLLLTSRIFLGPDDPAVLTQGRMVKMWTNFAKSGNPTPAADPLLDVTWPPYTVDNHLYLNVDKELTLQHDLNKDRLQFWKDLYASVRQ